MVPTPHDALFKFTFGKPEHAAGELRAVLPAELVRHLDFDQLRVEEGSFVDQELTERHADLLYSVPLGERQALIYLLFEHQSTTDPQMPFRLLRYLIRIWERWWKQNPEARRLPLIIPIVLYHGAERWSAPLAFEELVDIEGEIAVVAAPFVPRFECLLDDLSQHTTEDLRGRSLTALGRLVLHLFKNGRHATDFVDRLDEWGQALWQVWNAPDGLATLEAVIRYILQVRSDATPARMRAILGASVGQGSEEVIMTVAQQLIEQGIEKGIEKGIEQGIEQGEWANARLLAGRLLRLRFGELPPDVTLRLDQADLETLNGWAEGVLFAESLEALLG